MGMHAYACTVNTLERFTDFHGGSTIGAYIARAAREPSNACRRLQIVYQIACFFCTHGRHGRAR